MDRHKGFDQVLLAAFRTSFTRHIAQLWSKHWRIMTAKHQQKMVTFLDHQRWALNNRLPSFCTFSFQVDHRCMERWPWPRASLWWVLAWLCEGQMAPWYVQSKGCTNKEPSYSGVEQTKKSQQQKTSQTKICWFECKKTPFSNTH